MLVSRFVRVVDHELNTAVPEWFQRYLMEFARLDPRSMTFRYVDKRAAAPALEDSEVWVNLGHLRAAMAALARGFEVVLRELHRRRRPG
jgi:hypothetical protein